MGVNERMTAAEYRELATAPSKPRHGSDRRSDAPNPYVGLACSRCGLVVLQSVPAVMRTDIGRDGQVTHRSVAHLKCEVAA
jgi:hypothetical protein